MPKTQILEINNNPNTYNPDWSDSDSNLVITPTIYLNQEPISKTSPDLQITWYRRFGSGNAEEITSGSNNETISDNVLTVNDNRMTTANTLLTYIASFVYRDPDTGLPVSTEADVSYALMVTGRNGTNAKSALIAGEQVFKYENSTTVSPASIILTANLQNVTTPKWQYKKSNGKYADYPGAVAG